MPHAGPGRAMSNRACLGQKNDTGTGIHNGSGHSCLPSCSTDVTRACHITKHSHDFQSLWTSTSEVV